MISDCNIMSTQSQLERCVAENAFDADIAGIGVSNLQEYAPYRLSVPTDIACR